MYMAEEQGDSPGVDKVVPLAVCRLVLLEVPGTESCVLLHTDVDVQLLDLGGLIPRGTCKDNYNQPRYTTSC